MSRSVALVALIKARTFKMDQGDEMDDAKRLDYLISKNAMVRNDFDSSEPYEPILYWLEFNAKVEGEYWVQVGNYPTPRAAIDAAMQSQQSPVQASDSERRYEIVRKLTVPQFAELYRRNIAGEGRFDDLVDQLASDTGRQG